MIVVVCPGQGSQTPGFLEPWLAEPALAEHLAALLRVRRASTSSPHGTVSDADTIRDTAVAQPLIVAAGLLTLAALLDDGRRDAHRRRRRPLGRRAHRGGRRRHPERDGRDAPRRERGRAMADAAALERRPA